MLERFKDKKVHVIVAHHDDESLYFGGLLTEIKDIAEIKITVMTKPYENRPDTNTRIDSFKKVCDILSCKYSFGNIQDYPPIKENTIDLVKSKEMRNVINFTAEELKIFNADIILTHNINGEANKVYQSGHIMHKLIGLTLSHYLCGKIILCPTRGMHKTAMFEVDYNRDLKKKLLDCYAPNWMPDNYPFAYDNEEYFLQETL